MRTSLECISSRAITIIKLILADHLLWWRFGCALKLLREVQLFPLLTRERACIDSGTLQSAPPPTASYHVPRSLSVPARRDKEECRKVIHLHEARRVVQAPNLGLDNTILFLCQQFLLAQRSVNASWGKHVSFAKWLHRFCVPTKCLLVLREKQ